MPEDDRYTARDLAALTGVSERTVRYYVQEGLLPPPAGRGRGAHFTDDHLTRLKLIRALQQAGNDLDTIGDYLIELKGALAETGASVESVLAVWSGRNERAAMVEQWRQRGNIPQLLRRYRIATGVELTVDAQAAVAPARLEKILRDLRQAFGDDEDGP
ncbi:DNA-binding transcriptional MerR regulator [Caulobacter ginsengisoli]|uniref:DNA-binding transcriptional MerR regulator n=1 Tax=Caulobacter ginsengisoli TaxID=400775 RepID=A0ABU0IXP2_9CAUL|nr:helix-turn-helix domain-containing protein [Caulobacter ginsengisoli]MDQ0466781.1 DNA-binding transcriptional MerR regulator [Caulobacter ginsengisoli]